MAIFEKERKWANLKNYSLTSVESSLNPSRKMSETFTYMVDESKEVYSSPVSEWHKVVSKKVIESKSVRIVSDASSLAAEEMTTKFVQSSESVKISSSNTYSCVIS